MNCCVAKGAKGAKDAADAVSGTSGDVSAGGNVPEISWIPVPWLPGFKSVFVGSPTGGRR